MERQPLAFSLRTYRACDQQACRDLFIEGMLGDRTPADGDAGYDIDAIETHYLSSPANHFWVAVVNDPEAGEVVVGMIGVQGHGDGSAEIRRLRVHIRYRRQGIGSALVEQALAFCQQQHYLRIILDTYVEREPAVKLFEKFHFRHGRTRKNGQKDLLYFYLDLYGKTDHH